MSIYYFCNSDQHLKQRITTAIILLIKSLDCASVTMSSSTCCCNHSGIHDTSLCVWFKVRVKPSLVCHTSIWNSMTLAATVWNVDTVYYLICCADRCLVHSEQVHRNVNKQNSIRSISYDNCHTCSQTQISHCIELGSSPTAEKEDPHKTKSQNVCCEGKRITHTHTHTYTHTKPARCCMRQSYDKFAQDCRTICQPKKSYQL